MQGVSAMRPVLHVVPLEPFGNGGLSDIERLGRLAVGQAGILDLLADFWRGAGLRMNA